MKNLHLAFLIVVVAIVVVIPPAITGGAISIDKTVHVDTGKINATSGKTVDDINAEKIGFWAKLIAKLITDSDKPKETPSSSAECCSGVEDQISDLQNQIGDLQNKVDEMEARQNAPCQHVTIQSGNCNTACTNKGLKCAASQYTRRKIEQGILAAAPYVIYSHLTDCDTKDYFPADPEIQDEYECSCC